MSYDLIMVGIKGDNVHSKIKEFQENLGENFDWVIRNEDVDRFIEEIRSKFPENEDGDFDVNADYWFPPGIVKEENGGIYLYINDYVDEGNLQIFISDIEKLVAKYKFHIIDRQKGIEQDVEKTKHVEQTPKSFRTRILNLLKNVWNGNR